MGPNNSPSNVSWEIYNLFRIVIKTDSKCVGSLYFKKKRRDILDDSCRPPLLKRINFEWHLARL